MPDRSALARLLGFKSKPKSPAIGDGGEEVGKAAAKKRVKGTPSVTAGSESDRISKGTPRSAKPGRYVTEEEGSSQDPRTLGSRTNTNPYERITEVSTKLAGKTRDPQTMEQKYHIKKWKWSKK